MLSKTPTRAEVAAVLRAARDLMNNKGRHWTKFSFVSRRNHKGEDLPSKEYAYCALGALNKICGKRETALKNSAIEALSREIRTVSPGDIKVDDFSTIMIFNDSAKTTWDDIKDVFTRAARRLR